MIMDEIALDKIDRREPFALYVHLPFVIIDAIIATFTLPLGSIRNYDAR